MRNIFYVANNINKQEMLDDDWKTLKDCRHSLLENLNENEYGEIFKCQYLDDDTYEYDTLSIRFYKKVNGKLIAIKEREIK